MLSSENVAINAEASHRYPSVQCAKTEPFAKAQSWRHRVLPRSPLTSIKLVLKIWPIILQINGGLGALLVSLLFVITNLRAIAFFKPQVVLKTSHDFIKTKS